MCVHCCGDKFTCAVTILVLVLTAGTLCHVQHDVSYLLILSSVSEWLQQKGQSFETKVCHLCIYFTVWLCLFYSLAVSVLQFGHVYLTIWPCLFYSLAVSVLQFDHVYLTIWLCLFYSMAGSCRSIELCLIGRTWTFVLACVMLGSLGLQGNKSVAGFRGIILSPGGYSSERVPWSWPLAFIVNSFMSAMTENCLETKVYVQLDTF